MSLFDTLLGSTSRGSTNNQQSSSQNQIEEKNVAQQTNATTAQNQQQASSGSTTANTNTSQKNQSSGTTNSLNQDVVNTVSGLIKNLAGGNGQIDDIVTQLITKANTPAISDADILAEQNKAKLDFSQGEAVDIGSMKNRIGSNLNTYSALLDQKGQQDLSTTLAGIVAQAKSTNAQISTQQLMDALQGASAGSDQVANLVSALKGANTQSTISGTTTQDTTAQTIQNMLDILNGVTTAQQNSNTQENTAASADGTSSSNTQGKQGSGLLGLLF